MQNLIIKITQENTNLIADSKLQCFILPDSLPQSFMAEFYAKAKAAEKLVLISTHDPVTALSCQKRIIIENGGIRKILERTKEEQVLLEKLKEQDARLKQIRALIRGGENAA